MSSLTPSKSL
uniref:Uncharacterized protein n=1 Tax=Anguilla anguilla TaxID=7936 RepID=A0A0E9T9C0_ANGAN